MQHDGIEFPTVDLVQGGVTHDGEAVLVQLRTVEQGPIHFSLRAADLEAFVTFMLRMAASSRASPQSPERTQYEAIPLSSVSAGELEDGTGCLGLTVGGTELMFQFPPR